MSDVNSTPTRRSLLRASAWSVPVLAVTSAAPAFAASNGTQQCGAGDVMSSVGNAARATNVNATPLTYSFTQVADADPETLIVRTSTGDSLFFNPDVANVWPYVFANGAQVTYTPINALSGTFSFTVPAGQYLEFQADGRTPTGCTPSAVLTVTTVDCELTYNYRQCIPF